MFKTLVLAMLLLAWVPAVASELSQNEKVAGACETCMQPPSFAGGWMVVPENVRTVERALTSYPETMPPVTVVFDNASTLIDTEGTKTYRGVLKDWSLLSHATVTTRRDESQTAVLEYIEPIPHHRLFPSIYPLYRVVRVEMFISTDGTLKIEGRFTSSVEEDRGKEGIFTLKMSSGTAKVIKAW